MGKRRMRRRRAPVEGRSFHLSSASCFSQSLFGD
uniref:Uncharacterized protein n=1 Tax=Anguilla anguilla TaxID=7936 RepID=A0A0E9SJU7_ANGAN